MDSRPKITEEALAAAVVDWLKAQHWEVYQEVAHPGGVADIVATQGPLCWVIECKVSLGLNVLAQADRWTPYAHLVSIAVTKPKTPRRSGALVYRILRDYGIGRLVCVSGYDGSIVVEQDQAPPLHRINNSHSIRESLTEEQKDFAPAGKAGGSHWSPFQRTVRYLQEIVSKTPGISFKEMVAQLDHHYANDASAKSSLRHWISTDSIKGVRMEREGRHLKLYPEKETNQ